MKWVFVAFLRIENTVALFQDIPLPGYEESALIMTDIV